LKIPWFKMGTAFYRDHKIRLLRAMPEGDAIILLWVMLLSLAGEQNMHGQILVTDDIAYSCEMLATEFEVTVGLMRMALEAFLSMKMIEIDKKSQRIRIVNWHKWQNLEAFEKFRERQREAEKKRRYRERAQSKRNELDQGPQLEVSTTPKKDAPKRHVAKTGSGTELGTGGGQEGQIRVDIGVDKMVDTTAQDKQADSFMDGRKRGQNGGQLYENIDYRDKSEESTWGITGTKKE
jgi:predicted phage replisome organizer